MFVLMVVKSLRCGRSLWLLPSSGDDGVLLCRAGGFAISSTANIQN
jgi:hypothetical protein